MRPTFLSILMLLECSASAQTLDERIAAARQTIVKEPAKAQGYNELAAVLARKCRETANLDFCKQGEDAVTQSLKISPNNFDGQHARVPILLVEQRYAEALDEARRLNKKIPDDNSLYGFMADAEMALGEYAEAEKSAQWMIDMRQVNAPGLQRGARVRELLGYTDGALEWWGSALRLTTAADTEERAWILTQMARLNLTIGKTEPADKQLQQALVLEPEYPYALEQLASARMAQGMPGEAVDLLQRRLNRSVSIPAMYELALAIEKTGDTAKAAEAFEKFHNAAMDAETRPDNANRELILYFADHGRSKEAVSLAQRELARRKDIATLDAAAWAMYRNGSASEAKKLSDRALATGSKDLGIAKHGELISAQFKALAGKSAQ